MKILFLSPNNASFIARDLRILRERHDVTQRFVRHRNPLRFVGDVVALLRTDLLFLWFASAYALPIVTLARFLGKKVITVVGGYEVASVPEINYGSARSRVRRTVVGRILASSTVVLAVSRSSEQEIRLHHPEISGRVQMIYHGFEDMSSTAPPRKESLVANVGIVSDETWQRKGIHDFILVAEQMPEVRFVHIGSLRLDVVAKLGRALPDNLTIMGQVSPEKLIESLSTAKVYLQLSRHEAFGCSVAEAMLLGCIPIVTGSAALPEVVGDCGVTLESRHPADIAIAVRRALVMPDSEGERARQRVLQHFPYVRRRDALHQVVERLATK